MNDTIPDPGEIESILSRAGLDYKIKGDEISFPCPNGCDDDHRSGEEYHRCINAKTGLMHCFKCNADDGNIFTFRKMFGVKANSKSGGSRGRAVSKPSTMAQRCHENLGEHEQYYLGRGITKDNVAKYKLGYFEDDSGSWYTIPFFKNGECVSIKLRNAISGAKPKYRFWQKGSESIVYGGEDFLRSGSDKVLICGGEFDKIIAEQMDFGMPVITSTAGEATFKDEWIRDCLGNVRYVYICLDNDKTGISSSEKFANKIASLCPETSVFIIRFADDKPDKYDITDAYLDGMTAEELLKDAQFVAGIEPIDVSKFKPMSVGELTRVLDLTIKDDMVNKAVLFLAMISAYTESSQINICLLGQSSSGKTFLAKEISKLFPSVDVRTFGKVTPNALYYDDSNKTVDETGRTILDLSRKIVIFIDQPNSLLQAALRPLLSHDDKLIPFLQTNRDGKGKNASSEEYIKGFPVVVTCSANMRLDEQEQTRAILLSPKISQEKIASSISQITEINNDAEEFNAKLDANESRRLLKDRIIAIKGLYIRNINVPKELGAEQWFATLRGKKHFEARNTRDYVQFLSLIKACALLNAFFRKREGDDIYAEKEDLVMAELLWEHLNESQMLGVPPQALDFYKNYLLPAFIKKNDNVRIEDVEGLSIEDISVYYSNQGETMNITMVTKNYVPALKEKGLIQVYKDQNDRRRQMYVPLEFDLKQNEDDIRASFTEAGVD